MRLFFILASLFLWGAEPQIRIDWRGSFLDHGSLSSTNRQATCELNSVPGLQVRRIHNGAGISPGFEDLIAEVTQAPKDPAAITVCHAWPIDWTRPKSGKLVVVPTWEYGALPKNWFNMADGVDEFWAPSQYVGKILIESGIPARKIQIIHHGTNTNKFRPDVTPMKLATKKQFCFLFVGGTIWRKGADLLLKAYLKNFTAKDDVCLVIKDFGTKTFYANQTAGELIRKAQSDPNAPEILYIDRDISFEELASIYTACDCLVHPYRGEGFSLTVLEAMACALPVIVTKGGAADDFARDYGYPITAKKLFIGNIAGGLELMGNGWVLEPGLDSLGQQMRYVFEHQEEAKQRGLASSAFVSQHFSWDHAAQLMKERIRLLSQ